MGKMPYRNRELNKRVAAMHLTAFSLFGNNRNKLCAPLTNAEWPQTQRDHQITKPGYCSATAFCPSKG